MDKRQIALKLSLNALGLKPELDTFDGRLVLQKAIYLVQERGFKLGYHYSWYRRGPYSRQVTSDAFAVADALSSGVDESKDWELETESRRKLAETSSLWAAKGSQASWLELLASVHFLISRGQLASRNATAIHETLLKFGKDFDVCNIEDATKILLSAGMLPSETSSTNH
jgi:uncharacterized protein YwgA